MPLRRIIRRLKPYRNIILAIVLIGLLPKALLLAFSHHRLLSEAEESLESRVSLAHREVNQLLKTAETVLHQFAAAVESKSPGISDLLEQTVYQRAYFREAGVIDEDGSLILTDRGPVEPSVRIHPQRRADPGVSGMQLLGPHKTTVMRERSIILSLPTKGNGEVNVLVNPNLLLYFLTILDDKGLGPDGFVAFVDNQGKIIVSVGVPPAGGYAATEGGSSERIRMSMTTPDGLLRVVGEISTDWVLRNWRDAVVVGALLAILGSLLLLLIFFFIIRRTAALDYDLKAALGNDEMEVHYQPIVDMKTGEIVASEALIRWRHPDEGMLLPGIFIPAAEKTGLIGLIGEWIVKRVVEEQSPLLERFPRMYVSINLSPIELNSGSFEDVIKWLADAHVASGRFMFEVTEDALIRETRTAAMDTLARTRNLGYKVALDDFGTGYSSLKHLHKFEFDCLKIDQHFVRGINQDIRTNSILEAMVQLGHKLGVKLIAEGVETEEQRDCLLQLGVRFAQGWLFSRPLPIRELDNFVKARSASPKASVIGRVTSPTTSA